MNTVPRTYSNSGLGARHRSRDLLASQELLLEKLHSRLLLPKKLLVVPGPHLSKGVPVRDVDLTRARPVVTASLHRSGGLSARLLRILSV